MENEIKMITKQTGIQVGLFISCVVGVGSAIWWAAIMTSKMDMVLTQFESMRTSDIAQSHLIDQIKTRVDHLELLGSGKAQEAERRAADLEKRFEAHIAKP